MKPCALLLACLVAALPLSARQSVAPLGFDLALQQTLQFHPDLRAKQFQLQAQGFEVNAARAQRLPTFAANANNLNEQRDQGVLSLDQPLFSFGRVSSSIDLQKIGLTREQLDLLRLQRELLEETAAGFANLNGLQVRRQIAAQNAAEHNELHQSVQRRMQGQLASEADVTLAWSRLIQARAALQSVEGELAQAQTGLSALTQNPVGQVQAVPAAFANLNIHDLQLAELADQNSAALALARIEVESARQQALVTERESRPQLSLRLEHDFLDDSLVNPDDTRIGLVFQSSFEGLGLAARSRNQGAAARIQAAEYGLASAQVNLQRRVTTLLQDRQLQSQLLVAQQQVVSAIEETLDSFKRQYENGRKTWLDVLNTQRELTEQRYQLAGYETSWHMLNLRLAALTGQLDRVAGIAP